MISEGEEEEDGGREGQKGKNFFEKLERRAVFVGHRSGQPSTPVHISFFPKLSSSSSSSLVSSRKLASSLWEFYHYYHQDSHHTVPSSAAKMNRAPHGSSGPSNRRLRHGHGKAVIRDNGLDLTRFLPDASPDHQPEGGGSMRRQLGEMLMKHHQMIDRNNHVLQQPESPASFDSSLEVAPYNAAVTPGSSLEFRGRRAGETHYNLKTSTELLKVLNRIWSLEEQHAANISLIKSLRNELVHSRARIKELLRYQQADKRDLDDLVKQLAEEKLSRETKERDRITSAVQAVREELEAERKLRKRSESLHRKLARELSEVKSTLSNCIKEIERGTKSKKVLESLCDEFAKGIKSYEREIHGLKQKLDKNWGLGWNEEDQMILCVAESWLDERMQMKSEGNGSVLEKLEFEIETLLKRKQNSFSNEKSYVLPGNRRSSLESVPFNAMSAPIQEVDEDSGGSDSNCFELKKHESNVVAKPIGDEPEKQPKESDDLSGEKLQRKIESPSSLQVKFEDQMAWAMSCNGKKKTGAIDIEIEPESSNKPADEIDNSAAKTNNVVGEMIRTHRRLLSESREIDEASCSYPSRRQASPVRQWTSRTVIPDLGASKMAQGVKEHTLKAKLGEARSKSSQSRLRLFKS